MRSKSGERKTNLRPQSPGFVGREQDLARIAERFAAGERLVTLVGAGGMGKTRLASEYAARHVDDYAGVWFVDLTEARDLEGVISATARVLGVPMAGEVTAAQNLERLGDEIASRGQVLLILDNCEQVADAMSTQLDRGLTRAADARFLATSRERLRLDAEVAVAVGPLPADEAMQLFVERAQRIAEFAPDDEETGAIAKIVDQLDGMPLAIELAASRAGVLPPPALLERLSKRFDVLTGTSRGGEQRHQTLRSTIEWSWNLLEDWEREALAQFSVFRGGFTLGAAEAVLSLSDPDAPSALGVVQSLLDKSLVHANQEGRFGLYVSVREYAADRLVDLGGTAAARARHADHYLNVGLRAAATAFERGEAAAIDALRAEEDNLVAVIERGLSGTEPDPDQLTRALRALIALEPLRTTHGPFGPYRAQLDAALGAGSAGVVDAAIRARAHLARGRIHGYGGRHKQAVADLSRAVELAKGAKDRKTEGRAMFRLGITHANQGDFDVALAVYESALDLLRRCGDRLSEGQTLENLAIVYSERGKAEEAREHFAAAREIYVEVGDSRRQAVSLGNLGTLLMDEGRLDEARLHYDRAVATFAEIGDRRAHAFFVGHLGVIDQMEGKLSDAAARYEQAADTAREIGDRPYEAEHLGYLSTVLAARDEIERAAGLLSRAGDLLAGAGDVGAETALAIHGGHVDRALARRARTRGDTGAVERHVADARARIDALFEDEHAEPVRTPLPHKARVAVRLLELALGPQDAGVDDLPGDALVIGPDARWFRPPAGEPVDLFRRKTLRRLLRRLADQHGRAPNEGLSVAHLLEAGWPGERVTREAGANRVRVALATLRKLGLKEYIQSRADGYLLAPDLDVRDDARLNPPGI